MPKMANSLPRRPEGPSQPFLERLDAGLGRLARRRPFQAVVAGILLAFAVNAVMRAANPRRSSEFRGFRRIVQVSIVQGKDHYRTIPHIRAYPPFFAIAFAPFGLLPTAVGASLFVAVSLAFALWATWLCVRAAGGTSDPLGRAVLLFLLAGPFCLAAIARCESDMLVVLPLAGAFYLFSGGGTGRSAAAGLLLGFAAAFKLTPGVFGFYLLARRRWVALAAMAAAGLVLVGGLGTAVWGLKGNYARHRSWYEVVARPLAREGPTAFITRPYRGVNQSLTAALYRFLNARHAERLPWGARTNVADVPARRLLDVSNMLRSGFLLAFFAFWLACGKDRSSTGDRARFALAPLAMLFFSPVSLHTHHGVLMISYAAVLAAIGRGEGSKGLGVVKWLFVVSLVLMMLTGLRVGKALSSLVASDLLLLPALVVVACGGRGNRGEPARR